MSPIVSAVHAIVADRMRGQGAGHDFDHVLRVFANARQIQAIEGGNAVTIDLAALLHDIGDAKFHDGVELSGEFSRQILTDLDVNWSIIDHVVHIVDNISFRKGIDSNTLSTEGKIVQDADRLDALGAVGIVRTIEYGAVKGQPFDRPGDSPTKMSDEGPSGVGHFHEKLFKLQSLLNTDTAKRIAGDRESFMRMFLEQYFREIAPA